MKTSWRDVVGYEGIYQVSNIGHVKRVTKGRRTRVGKILKQSLRGRKNHQYLCVCLYRNGQKKVIQVYTLVAHRFGVLQTTISRVVLRLTWKHIN
ncbi:MAG: hypothetical protein DRJ03_00330 [Chloroflexi bacterium]|nr:MAG: hypothetical protein DRJ03_00330 [Chloroflexota bacterium]